MDGIQRNIIIRKKDIKFLIYCCGFGFGILHQYDPNLYESVPTHVRYLQIDYHHHRYSATPNN